MINKILAFIFFLSATWRPVDAQPDYSKVKVDLQKITGSVYSIKLSMPINYNGKTIDWFVNLGASIGQDGILLIDTGFEKTFDIVYSELKKVSDKDITFVINTHPHQDHTGGNKLIGADASIIAHSFTKRILGMEQK